MGTSKFITGSGDIQLNQDLWKKCPYKVIYKVTTYKVVSQQIYIVFRKKKIINRSLMGSTRLG